MGRGYDSEELIKRAVAAVKRWRDRPDWEDIRQEAILGALYATERALKTGKCDWTLACTRGARWGATEYLFPRAGRRNKFKAPEIVSLETVRETHGEENGWEPPAPDFAPGLIEQVGLWQEVERHATEAELPFAQRCWWEDVSNEQAAKEMGVSKSLVSLRLRELRQRLMTDGTTPGTGGLR